MKKLFFFLSIIILLSVVYIALINTSSYVDVNWLKGGHYTADLTKAIRLSSYTLLVLIAGIFFLLPSSKESILVQSYPDVLEVFKV